jgi:hypothetical protein
MAALRVSMVEIGTGSPPDIKMASVFGSLSSSCTLVYSLPRKRNMKGSQAFQEYKFFSVSSLRENFSIIPQAFYHEL